MYNYSICDCLLCEHAMLLSPTCSLFKTLTDLTAHVFKTCHFDVVFKWHNSFFFLPEVKHKTKQQSFEFRRHECPCRITSVEHNACVLEWLSLNDFTQMKRMSFLFRFSTFGVISEPEHAAVCEICVVLSDQTWKYLQFLQNSHSELQHFFDLALFVSTYCVILNVCGLLWCTRCW